MAVEEPEEIAILIVPLWRITSPGPYLVPSYPVGVALFLFLWALNSGRVRRPNQFFFGLGC